MDIRINNFNNFKSKAYPVKPFVIKTKHGKLNVSEVTQKDLKRDGFIFNLTKFFCKNFALQTKDPNWRIFNNPKNINYEQTLIDFSRYYNAKIKHNHDYMTLLLVKDKRNKIQGACLSYGYDRIPNAREYACYIDSIAINPAYRGFHIGKLLLEKTIESAKNKFTDVFLTGDKMSYGFYEKMGFEPLSVANEGQKNVIDYLSKRRSDYPQYIELFTKPLQDSKERWYDKIIINE